MEAEDADILVLTETKVCIRDRFVSGELTDLCRSTTRHWTQHSHNDTRTVTGQFRRRRHIVSYSLNVPLAFTRF